MFSEGEKFVPPKADRYTLRSNPSIVTAAAITHAAISINTILFVHALYEIQLRTKETALSRVLKFS